MTQNEFLAAPVDCWFSEARNAIEPEWFATAWRRDPEFRDEITHETYRYIAKVGALVDAELLAMLARALGRKEVLALAEQFRQHARHRILEWGATFEKAFASLRIVLTLSAEELAQVGKALMVAIHEGKMDQIRFLARCMRDAGLPPEQATFKNIVCGLTAGEIATMPREQFDRLPFQWMPVVEYAEKSGLLEIAQIIRSGG